jgi:hypothetical protein
MPGIADKFTQSAQRRLLWPGMTILLERGEVKEETYPTSPFIAFTGALSGNTVSASTRSATPR